ncbi:hypothetical protein PF005_g22987 [Phytophthora fragariae]|uniref:Uncharacterized protein n=1 Tax=Phytophthora fragariae TaxID=53985 RepID=A0A6A3QZL4_9STRA|nr:hypothetical protein PF003_g2801 [Phytophthora fragariae]KAE8928356.1 hypothetical protein PF009_g21500 [Phytophthora fragariae]KAE8983852.1 hypothetical protein PF011_g21012 [Phytophthora fragariae]KAE9082409.1 hypothetical protein PF010_g21597 [Phytophthora fragariae]KAE9086627.1 hypothetical protein PF007_g20703 [Phytophthora fragariae]
MTMVRASDPTELAAIGSANAQGAVYRPCMVAAPDRLKSLAGSPAFNLWPPGGPQVSGASPLTSRLLVAEVGLKSKRPTEQLRAACKSAGLPIPRRRWRDCSMCGSSLGLRDAPRAHGELESGQ